MSIHKLTAGDGYAYLTRQVAALDATDMQHTGLADYYSQRGEVPGRWAGSALADVDMTAGQEVTADQMAALFAEGRHPNADQITADLTRAQASAEGRGRRDRAGQAVPPAGGHPRLPGRGRPARRARSTSPTVPPGTRSWRPRSGPGSAPRWAGRCSPRPTAGPRRTPGSCPRSSPATPASTTSAIAGFDLTFSPVKSVSALWAIAATAGRRRRSAPPTTPPSPTPWAGWSGKPPTPAAGSDGVQQVDTTGLVAAAFDHRDSRAGDPDLHTHVAVSNKVRVRAADGTPAGGWPSTAGCCSRPPSPRPSGTTPASRPSCTDGSG